MTNVPDAVRKIWTEIYVLFDKHYQMENTAESWNQFWEDVREVYHRNGNNQRILDASILLADCIADRMRERMEKVNA